MLFNSYNFFGFLLITLILFFGLKNKNLSIYTLIFSSLFFYTCFNPKFLLFLIPAILINYFLGKLLIFFEKNVVLKKSIIIFAILINLAALLFFKYINFFFLNLNYFMTQPLQYLTIAAPIGISFFVFQKIAFLVNIYKGEIKNIQFKNFMLFATFFPPLIAGPLFHYTEFAPQSSDIEKFCKLNLNNIIIGVSIFSIGIFKKVILADACANIADPIFNTRIISESLSFEQAWLAALSYTFQIYFDFSGYSDMATGIARMFNIILPVNFNSPYQSHNIITFWRRWHMSLSRFFRDYIYIPMGGKNNRFGKFFNLIFVMSLCGLWHGANYTFILWGMMHGVLLVINHVWRDLTKENIFMKNSKIFHYFSILITFMVVVTLWVVFRANDLTIASTIIKKMYQFDYHYIISNFKFNLFSSHGILIFCLMITLLFPSLSDTFKNYHPYLDVNLGNKRQAYLTWSSSFYWAIFISILFTISLLNISKPSSFIYFNF